MIIFALIIRVLESCDYVRQYVTCKSYPLSRLDEEWREREVFVRNDVNCNQFLLLRRYSDVLHLDYFDIPKT